MERSARTALGRGSGLKGWSPAKEWGFGEGYKYAHDDPSDRGYEARMRERGELE